MRFPRYSVLLQRRHENGKPSASSGRKATGPLQGAAELPNVAQGPDLSGPSSEERRESLSGVSSRMEKDLMGRVGTLLFLPALGPGGGSRCFQVGTFPPPAPKAPLGGSAVSPDPVLGVPGLPTQRSHADPLHPHPTHTLQRRMRRPVLLYHRDRLCRNGARTRAPAPRIFARRPVAQPPGRASAPQSPR